MTNTTGKIFRVTTFGSSHGKALGAVIDGCPANLELNEKDIQIELDKRRPGASNLTTSRNELDKVEILSGIFKGKTDGTPITAIVFNKDKSSKDYEYLKNKPRPSHGDFSWISKYGNYDYYGGGRGSGRTTIGIVIAGAIAKKILSLYNIKVFSHVTQIGDIKAKKIDINLIEEYSKKNNLKCADIEVAKLMEEKILKLKEEGNSIGGVVETIAIGVPTGLGEPVFGRLDGEIAKALMNIGSVKGVEIGYGFKITELTGHEANDEFYISEYSVKTRNNKSGGILGGMSNGMPIITRIAVKPTPSISTIQKTVDLEKMEDVEIKIKGRHDPCICPRITTVTESSLAIVLLDFMLKGGFIPMHNLNMK
ncbi:MAG: chorismate synthase [Methanobrevibacter sp.]|nr:chorismate synthase [Candidatus Methanovirga meridionalis]